jgi:hypothetical protein
LRLRTLVRPPKAINTSRTLAAGWVAGTQSDKLAFSSACSSAPRAMPLGRKVMALAREEMPALARSTSGAVMVPVLMISSPALTVPSPLVSVNTIQPSQTSSDAQAASVTLRHNTTERLRLMASLRARCTAPVTSLAAEDRRVLAITLWKLGTPMAITITSRAMVIISSISVRPRTPPLPSLCMSPGPSIERPHAKP